MKYILRLFVNICVLVAAISASLIVEPEIKKAALRGLEHLMKKNGVQCWRFVNDPSSAVSFILIQPFLTGSKTVSKFQVCHHSYLSKLKGEHFSRALAVIHAQSLKLQEAIPHVIDQVVEDCYDPVRFPSLFGYYQVMIWEYDAAARIITAVIDCFSKAVDRLQYKHNTDSEWLQYITEHEKLQAITSRLGLNSIEPELVQGTCDGNGHCADFLFLILLQNIDTLIEMREQAESQSLAVSRLMSILELAEMFNVKWNMALSMEFMVRALKPHFEPRKFRDGGRTVLENLLKQLKLVRTQMNLFSLSATDENLSEILNHFNPIRIAYAMGQIPDEFIEALSYRDPDQPIELLKLEHKAAKDKLDLLSTAISKVSDALNAPDFDQIALMDIAPLLAVSKAFQLELQPTIHDIIEF